MAGTGSRSAYVGRELELDRLTRRLEAAAEGRGGVVVLRGPSGVGATRTAHEVAGRADRLGMVALWGQTVDGFSGRPYGAIAEALEELGTGTAGGSLRGHLAGGAPPLARLCPRLREVLPDIAPAAPLETVDERLRLYDAVVGWLRRASAERPILLVLDDWQWADDDSRLLLGYLARWVQSLPVLVLLTEAGTVGAAELAAPPEGAEVVELGGLDEGAVDVILGDIAERPLSQPAVTAIHQVSAGHPLFVRELYLHARESGLLIGGGELVAADLPATYEAVIAWRLSRLPLDTRTVLNAIACFPHGVGAGLLTEVTGMARARLIDVVERAVSAGLVRPAEQGQRYTLYHDRLRLTLAAGVPARVRAAVHRRAEEAREAELGEDARGHAAELVDHLIAVWNVEPPGGTDSRAVRHLLVAAEQARAAYAHRRAATLLGYAVKAFGEGRQTDYVDLTARHALANAEAGLTDPAVAGVRELVTGQRRHGPLVRETWSDIVATIRTLRYGGDVATAAALARTSADEGAPRDELVRHRLRLLAEEWHTTEPEAFQPLPGGPTIRRLPTRWLPAAMRRTAPMPSSINDRAGRRSPDG